MRDHLLTFLRRYGLSLATTSLAVVWTVLFWAVCQYAPYGLFIGAVLVSAWRGQARQGLATTALSTAVLTWIYFQSLYPAQPEMWESSFIRLVLFALVGMTATFLSHQCRRAVEAVDGFHGTLASIGDVVICTDSAGRITTLNAAAERLTDWPLRDARGKPWSQAIHILDEATREATADPVARALRDNQPVDLAGSLVRTKAGLETPVEGRAGLLRDARDNVVGAMLILRDISQRRQAEHDLRQREVQYRALAGAAPAGLLLFDSTGRCFFSNATCQSACGFTAEEGLGEGWVRAIHADDRSRVAGEWLSAVQTVQGYGSEFRLQPRQEGIPRWVRLRSAPMLADSGQVVGHVGLLEDLTERKSLEDALRGQETRLAEQHRLENELRQAAANHERELCALQSDQARLQETLRQAGLDHERQLQGRLAEQCRLEEMLRVAGESLERARTERQAELDRVQEALNRQRGEYERHMAECSPRRKQAEEALLKARTELEQHLAECGQRQRQAEEALHAREAEWQRRLEEQSEGQHDFEEKLRQVRLEFDLQLEERLAAQRLAEQMLRSDREELTRMIDEQAAQHDKSLAELREQLAQKQLLVDQHRQQLAALQESHVVDVAAHQQRQELQARQETRLRQEKELLEQIIDKSRDGLLAYDRDHRLLVWNAVMERITGRSRPDALGQSVFDLFPRLKDNEEGRHFDETLGGEQPRTKLDALRVGDADGTSIIEAAFAPLHGPDAQIVGGMALVHQRTHRRPSARPRQRPSEEPVNEFSETNLDDGLLTVLVSEMPIAGELATEELRRPWPGWERSLDWLAYN
jgi:PAS domain S-box-containing protein